MWIKIIIYQSTLKVEVLCESIIMSLINSTMQLYLLHVDHKRIVKMTAKLVQECIVTCQMMIAPCPTNLIWFFSKTKMQKLKFRLWNLSTEIPFSITCKAVHDGTLWPQNTIWTNLKDPYPIHKLCLSTVLWPNLPKFITYF